MSGNINAPSNEVRVQRVDMNTVLNVYRQDCNTTSGFDKNTLTAATKEAMGLIEAIYGDNPRFKRALDHFRGTYPDEGYMLGHLFTTESPLVLYLAQDTRDRVVGVVGVQFHDTDRVEWASGSIRGTETAQLINNVENDGRHNGVEPHFHINWTSVAPDVEDRMAVFTMLVDRAIADIERWLLEDTELDHINVTLNLHRLNEIRKMLHIWEQKYGFSKVGRLGDLGRLPSTEDLSGLKELWTLRRRIEKAALEARGEV